jgi:hypothetical protein
MKDHRLLNKHEMAKVKLKSSITDVCQIHDGETIKYFCQEHEDRQTDRQTRMIYGSAAGSVLGFMWQGSTVMAVLVRL